MIEYYSQGEGVYTPITERDGKHSAMLMNFGLINLQQGQRYRVVSERCESALLVLNGSLTLSWNGGTQRVSRGSLLDEAPHVLHVSAGCAVEIEAHGEAELALQQTENARDFAPVFYAPSEVQTAKFGDGVLQGTSTRVVRTVFDAASAPYSNMVLGEVVNFPGRWSSYPPHNHPQPEVYHYRFFPSHGFGFGEVGDKVYKLKDKSTLMIEPWVVHPQTAAPGYAMYYIWMIPHLPEAKFGPDSRQFVEPHTWLLDKGADAAVWGYKGS